MQARGGWILITKRQRKVSLCFFFSPCLHRHGDVQDKKKQPEVIPPSVRGRKTTFPISHSCPMECWDCSSDCRISINLEMQLDTGASGREGGGHSQGQSLARHAIATSSLIDLYKADPPAAILSHWFRLLSLQNWTTGQDAALRLLYYSVTSTTAMEAISPVKNQSGRGSAFWISDLSAWNIYSCT